MRYTHYIRRLHAARRQEEVDALVRSAHMNLRPSDFGRFLARVLDRRRQLPERGEPA